jgi:hypothetical protein
MKRTPPERRAWLDARCRRRHGQSIRAAGLRKPRRKALPRDFLLAPHFFALYTTGRREAAAPRLFFQFLERIRGFRGKRLRIDMSGVSRIEATAALAFKAELRYHAAKGVTLGGIPPRKMRSLQVLTQTGICDLLGLPCAQTVDREDTVHWRHTSGVWSLAQPSRLRELLDPGLRRNGESLYTGMIETVANSIEHAYMDHPARRSFADGVEGWWAFQQLRDGRLTTCICDLGIGIAASLPISLSEEPDLLKKLLYVNRRLKGRERQALLAAVEYGRSRTKERPRGKGLSDAHKVIDDSGQGTFQLISNSALYFYERVAGNPHPRSGTLRLQGSVSGTISSWVFPIESSSEGASS